MIAITTIIMLIRLQRFLKPYKLKINNEVENSSMVAIGFTLYGGLLFIKGQSKVSFIDALVFMLIIAVNSVYIIFWVYLMAKTYDWFEIAKKLSILLKIVLFRMKMTLRSNNQPKINEFKSKKKGKGLRFDSNQIIKQDQQEKDRYSQIFMMNSAKTVHSKCSRGILKYKHKNSFEESKYPSKIWNEISKDSIDSKLNSVDMIYVVGESSIRESKGLISELSNPKNSLKLSPIINRQAHKVHIVRKLNETQKSIIAKNSVRSD